MIKLLGRKRSREKSGILETVRDWQLYRCGEIPEVQLCVQADRGTRARLQPDHFVPRRLNAALGFTGGNMGMCGQFKVLAEEELQIISANPACIEDVLFPANGDYPTPGQYDIDKCWHELHYLLTGKADKDGSILGEAVLGGAEIGPEMGYGKARLISRELVKKIYSELKELDFRALVKLVDRTSPVIDHIYCGSGLRGDASYLERPFGTLVDAYRNGAYRDAAILAFLA